ncbi:MAG: hypothetical protein EDS66_06825 [Planctomycetota bacterium]|nr:MAG: hypothetical protein EDS66_06825 [Planctomycetota bacterium]MCQ3920707.1 hypothetical protein [Planctomycetota bacterium]
MNVGRLIFESLNLGSSNLAQSSLRRPSLTHASARRLNFVRLNVESSEFSSGPDCSDLRLIRRPMPG